MRLSSWLLIVLLAGRTAAQTSLLEVHGRYPGELFGTELGVVGDLDGDRVPEFLVARGAATPVSERPELYVHSGRDGHLLYVLPGAGPMDVLFRLSVLALGDVDLDGVPDIAFGTTSARVDGRPNRGRVSVFSGRTGARLHVSEGTVPSGAFGASLAVLGDVDDDGRPDYVVGQIGTQDENAWVVSGASGAQLGSVPGPRTGDPEFGWSVVGTGDLDHDGYGDFAVGTLRKGVVYVYSGRQRTLLVAHSGGNSFGRQLANLGDLDGDGEEELLVAETNRHVVWILSPRAGLRSAVPTLDRAESIAAVGDIDGDRRCDFLVGDGAAEEGRGVVRLFSSRARVAQLKWTGRAPGDRLGASLAGGLDFDRDGRPDVLLGAPGTDALLRSADVGSAELYSTVTTGRR